MRRASKAEEEIRENEEQHRSISKSSTIAEFVANEMIKGMLKEIGVDYAQGYGINRPMPLEELLAQASDAADMNKLRALTLFRRKAFNMTFSYCQSYGAVAVFNL